MKKRLKNFSIIAFIIMIIIIMVHIQENTSFDKYLSMEELPVTLDYVDIEIKEGTLTRKSVTVSITNKSDSRIASGNWYRIDKKEDNGWVKLKSKDKNYIVSLGIDEIERKSYNEKIIDWSKQYGKLKKGQYRLVKEIYGLKEKDEYIAVEFTIE